jgi:hypothetical protein
MTPTHDLLARSSEQELCQESCYRATALGFKIHDNQPGAKVLIRDTWCVVRDQEQDSTNKNFNNSLPFAILSVTHHAPRTTYHVRSIDNLPVDVLKRLLVSMFNLQVGDNFFQTPSAPVAYNSGMTISALLSSPEEQQFLARRLAI